MSDLIPDLVLVYDTETTGIPLYHEPSEGDNQPHIAELYAALVNLETGEVVESMHAYGLPDGWDMPAEAAAINGLTTPFLREHGAAEHLILSRFLAMHDRCTMRIGHQEQFDARIIRIAIKRFGHGGEGWDDMQQVDKDWIADKFKEAPKYCTSRVAARQMKLPATPAMIAKGMGHFHKEPKLSEAYAFYTGQVLENAHSAQADAMATLAVYREQQTDKWREAPKSAATRAPRKRAPPKASKVQARSELAKAVSALAKPNVPARYMVFADGRPNRTLYGKIDRQLAADLLGARALSRIMLPNGKMMVIDDTCIAAPNREATLLFRVTEMAADHPDHEILGDVLVLDAKEDLH